MQRFQNTTVEDEYEGQHEAIIDEATFNKVQELLNENLKTRGARHQNKYGALLKGILVCGHCNRAMIPTYTDKGNRTYRYYRCIEKEKNGAGQCPTPLLPADKIESVIVKQIKRIGHNSGYGEKVLADLRSRIAEELNSLRFEHNNLKTELVSKREEARVLVMTHASNPNGSTAINERLLEVEEVISQLDTRNNDLQEQIAFMENQAIDESHFRKCYRSFDKIWDNLFPREKISLVQKLIKRVIFNPDTCKIDVNYTNRGIELLSPGENR